MSLGQSYVNKRSQRHSVKRHLQEKIVRLVHDRSLG